MDTEPTTELLRAYRKRMEPLLANAPPGLADEMLPSLAPRSSSGAELAALQLGVAPQLPPSLLAYLKAPTVECEIEWAEICVPGNTSLSQWQTFFDQQDFSAIGLLQVAMGPCGDPVCLDLLRRCDDGECPVVVINHDWVGAEEWTSACDVRRYISAEFPSFFELLRVLCEGLPVEYRKEFSKG